MKRRPWYPLRGLWRITGMARPKKYGKKALPKGQDEPARAEAGEVPEGHLTRPADRRQVLPHKMTLLAYWVRL